MFCLIADGDSADSLPSALGVGAEPLAADIRRSRDGRGAALLKLAAGLLGVLAGGVAMAVGTVALAYIAASDAGLGLPDSVALAVVCPPASTAADQCAGCFGAGP